MFTPISSLNRVSCLIFNKGVGCSCHSLNRKETISTSIKALSTNVDSVILCSSSSIQPKSRQFSKRKSILNSNYLSKPTSISLLATQSSSASSGVGSTKLNKVEDSLKVDESSFKSKVKYMWKSYGAIAIGTYFGLYLTTLGSLFFALDFDVFHAASVGLDPVHAVQKVCDIFERVTGNGALPNYIRENPRVGTFAVAWVMTKFTEPIRLGVTLLTVPSIARFFGKVPAVTVTVADTTNQDEVSSKKSQT